MKTIFFIIFLLISVFGFSQNPSNYQYRTVRERLLAMMVDSSFHIPRYNGVPSGLRVGSAYHDGALAADTLNGRIYHYWNNTWNRLANYTDIGTLNLQQVTDNGNTTTNTIVAPVFNDASALFQLSVVAGQGRLSLSNGTATDHIRPQAASAGSSNRLPNTGNANDTLFTFYDFRTLGGGGGGTPTLQQVTTAGNTSTNSIILKHNSGISIVDGSDQVAASLFRVSSSGGGNLDLRNTSQFKNLIYVSEDQANNDNLMLPNTGNTSDTIATLFDIRAGGGGGGGSPAGNFGNVQINRYGSFATPGSDSLNHTALGLHVTGNIYASNNLVAANQSLVGNLAQFTKVFSASTPPSGYFNIYAKYDDSLYAKDENGIETNLMRGAAGGGSNFANADLTFTGDRFHDMDGNELELDDGAFPQLIIKPADGVYSIGDIAGQNNTTYLAFFDTATVSPRWKMTNIQEGTTAKILYYNPVDGHVTYDDAPSSTIDVNFNEWYTFKDEFPQNQSGNFEWNAAFSASVAALTTDIPDGWMFGGRFSTAASSTGLARTWVSPSAAGVHAGIAIVSGKRFNVGWKIQLTDLSDGTDTYKIFAGFADNSQLSNVTDGVYFTYTHSASSGQFVCNTESNNSITSTASGVTVAADTDYELEISVYNGSAYFYINKTLVHTETSTIPTGNARATGVGASIEKSAGTNARDMLIDWGAYGVRAN